MQNTENNEKTAAGGQNVSKELKLTDYYIRHYTDNGQITAYAQWNDGVRTEGKPDSAHMSYLRLRAHKEGVQIRNEKW
jgi:hypothetical protein